MGGDILSVLSAGAPNIIGVGAFGKGDTLKPSGAFQAFYQDNYGATGAGAIAYFSDFDASRCSNVYGASDTVQPPAISMIPQIKY